MKEKKYYGKEKCRILKQIRAEIAKQNDIAWVVEECSHKGNCRGTCPKCEAEVRQLEKALERRAALGKTVAIVGISAGLSLSVTGCMDMFRPTAGVPMPPADSTPLYEESTDEIILPGAPEETYTEISDGQELPIPGEELIEGTLPPETEDDTMEIVVPMGDMVEIPEDESDDETEPPYPEIMGMVVLPSDDET